MTPRDYLSRGLALVLVPPNSKGPNSKGWQNLQPTLVEVERHLAAGGNLGVILGPASGSLVDVDLDCGEALMLADTYLPPTAANLRPRVEAAIAPALHRARYGIRGV